MEMQQNIKNKCVNETQSAGAQSAFTAPRFQPSQPQKHEMQIQLHQPVTPSVNPVCTEPIAPFSPTKQLS